MALFLLNTRELRSFKIRKNGLDLCEFIKDKNKSVAFGVSYSFYTDTRLSIKDTLSKQNLKAVLFSLRIFRFLFKSTEWLLIKNLLRGQIFLITSKDNNVFVKENLKFLSTTNQFFLRLVLSNQIFYRKERLNTLIKSGLDLKASQIKIVQDLKYSQLKLFSKIYNLRFIK